MQEDKIKVVIAGQSPFVRIGLAHALYNEGASVRIIREVDSLSDVEQALTNIEPDVAVIENSFATWEVVDLLKKLHAACSVPILVLSGQADRRYVESVLGAGARGFFLSIEPLELLLPAIRKILNGGTYLSERLSQEVMQATDENDWGGRFRIDQLSEPELQIFRLTGLGYDINEISEKLHISTDTVENHRRYTRQKLAINNTSEFLRRAISWVVSTLSQVANQREARSLQNGPHSKSSTLR